MSCPTSVIVFGVHYNMDHQVFYIMILAENDVLICMQDLKSTTMSSSLLSMLFKKDDF